MLLIILFLQPREVEDHFLPRMISKITGQTTVPFGDAVISTRDTCLGTEMCEEIFAADNIHAHMSEDGVEIFTNGSGSHHELRKLDTRLNLILNATARVCQIFCKVVLLSSFFESYTNLRNIWL